MTTTQTPADLTSARSAHDEERTIARVLAHRDTITGDAYAELLAAALAEPVR